MDSLKTLVLEYFNDTLYEANVVMRSSRDKKLTVVTDNLRGVCGITVSRLWAQQSQYRIQ